MAQLSNVVLNNNRRLFQLHLVEESYSKALIGKAIHDRIDRRVRYRQEVKGDIQQLHECASMAEVRRWMFRITEETEHQLKHVHR